MRAAFWILTWSPIDTPLSMKASLPMMQSEPIVAPSRIWARCHTAVRGPMLTPCSISAEGCTVAQGSIIGDGDAGTSATLAALQGGGNGPQQDLEVEPQRPTVDVLEVRLYPAV